LNNLQQDVHLRTFAGDLAILYEIFWLKIYQKFSINYAALETIVDIGANIGLATLFFRSLSPQARIIAVEPESKSFKVLESNLRSTFLAEKITTVNAAINCIDSPLSLKIGRFAYNTAISNLPQGAMVAGISLNTLIDRYDLKKIDLLKIDVEGFEHEIFKANLKWLNIVENIIIEIHSEMDYSTCIETLLQTGFEIQKLESKSVAPENIYWAFRKAAVLN
jgi:FkbM family methyltransferase